MSLTIDGPRVNPLSGTTRQLVVFLHGYGADGNDLIEIGRQWQRWMPDATFISPHAPEPCGMSPMGRQWFNLTFEEPNERWLGVNNAAPDLNRFLDNELKRHGLSDKQLALVGFSQGTMMALHVGLRRANAPAAVIGYSGLLIYDETRDPRDLTAEITSKPPVLLVHGDQDEIIPVQASSMSTQLLAEFNVPTQWHLSYGIGHGIDGEGLRQGALFLLKNFGLPYPSE